MNKCFLIYFLLLSLCVNGFGQSPIHIMTYNIRNSHAPDGLNQWKNRKENLANLILQVNPDVLGTQEVLLDQYKNLTKMLPAYAVFGVGRDNGKHAGEHSCIFYKQEKYTLIKGGNFWLSETPNKPGSKSWDAAITRICSWVQLEDKANMSSFFVFNTHFDHIGVKARKNSAVLLCHFIDSICGNKPVVVTGDFNFEPGSDGYKVMIDSAHAIGLYDSYLTTEPNFTDCGFDVKNTNCHRIDYIFFSNHFTNNGYHLYTNNNGKSYPSDHLTISTKLVPAY